MSEDEFPEIEQTVTEAVAAAVDCHVKAYQLERILDGVTALAGLKRGKYISDMEALQDIADEVHTGVCAVLHGCDVLTMTVLVASLFIDKALRIGTFELSDELMAEATCDRTQTMSVEDIRKRFAEQVFKTIDGDS